VRGTRGNEGLGEWFAGLEKSVNRMNYIERGEVLQYRFNLVRKRCSDQCCGTCLCDSVDVGDFGCEKLLAFGSPVVVRIRDAILVSMYYGSKDI
jgi:hypothetical protein